MLVLASASPRRQHLLSLLGLQFEVVTPNVEEHFRSGERPKTAARRLAQAKALVVAHAHPEAFVLAADTVVACAGRLLAKPADAPEAAAMLRLLRARTHRVITAVAVVLSAGRRALVAHSVTRVRMRAYGDDEIAASIASGQPFDKAGAYAVQDPDLRPVDSLQGCYCNVVGLPLWTTRALLARAGLPVARPFPPSGAPPHCHSCPDRPRSGP